MNFIGVLIYMWINVLSSSDDCWAMETRVSQVTQLISSERFRLKKRLIHFNNNNLIPGTSDRFFKIRPQFSFLSTAFRSVPETPKQSIDEVMIAAYKGKTAGNLRQYKGSKPDKWDFSCLLGLLRMSSFTTWCCTKERQRWRIMVSPWCLKHKLWVPPAR